MLVGRGDGRQGREPDSKAMWSTVYQSFPGVLLTGNFGALQGAHLRGTARLLEHLKNFFKLIAHGFFF